MHSLGSLVVLVAVVVSCVAADPTSTDEEFTEVKRAPMRFGKRLLPDTGAVGQLARDQRAPSRLAMTLL